MHVTAGCWHVVLMRVVIPYLVGLLLPLLLQVIYPQKDKQNMPSAFAAGTGRWFC
jgi:hypothetical protein